MQKMQQLKPTLPWRCLRTLLLCAGLYLLACVGCASFQRRLIYFPTAFSAQDVDAMAASENLERWKSSAGKPIGWKRLSPRQPARASVLVSHGNACCAFQCRRYVDAIQASAPLDVFIVEYPGYADCPGKPSEAALDDAASRALETLATASASPVYLIGESLGTGVAAHLAGKYPEKIAGIVLLAPYPRLADVAQAHIRIFPVHWMLSEHFPAEENLRNYRGPVAALVGGRDTVVPQRFGRTLYERYAGPKRLWEFPQLDHDSLMDQPPGIWKQIVEFWEINDPNPKRRVN